MRIYFSGGGGLKDTPEVLIPECGPHVMLTFHTLNKRETSATSRLFAFLKRGKRPTERQDIEPKKKKK